MPLRGSPNLRRFTRLGPILDGDDPAVLLVEYQGTRDEGLAGLERLRAILADLGARVETFFASAAEVNEAWELRRASLPLLMGAPGVERPASFVEDTAVPPESLADYVEEFQRVVAAHGVRASFTGHASAGCMHVRPMLDLKSARASARWRPSPARSATSWPRATAPSRASTATGSRARGSTRSVRSRALRRVRRPQATCSIRDRLLSPGRKVEGPPVSREPALRRGLPRPLRMAAATVVRPRGRFRPGRRALLRRRAAQETGGYHVPAGGGLGERAAHDPGARQPAAGGGGRRGAARPGRRGGVRGRAGHLPGLQGLQRRVPGGGRHGGAQGGVAGRGQRPPWDAAPGARRRRPAHALPAGGAGRAAGQRAGARACGRALMPLVGVDPRRPAPAIARRSFSSRRGDGVRQVTGSISAAASDGSPGSPAAASPT